MKFIALKSDELDMKTVASYIKDFGDTFIAKDYDEVIKTINDSIHTADYYKLLFVYPAENSHECFNMIKQIRTMESNMETHLHIIIFSNNELGIPLLDKFSMTTETFISKKIIKRKLVEIIESKVKQL